MNIVECSDEEIRHMADPLWRGLLKSSNEGKYGEFVQKFARSLALEPGYSTTGIVEQILARKP